MNFLLISEFSRSWRRAMRALGAASAALVLVGAGAATVGLTHSETHHHPARQQLAGYTALTPVARIDAPTAATYDCARLPAVNFSGIPGAPTVILSARVVPESGPTHEYCDVTGYVQPQVQFEMRLPTKTWNGRYFQAGCGAFCGTVPIFNCSDALAQDFAVAAQNMGHVSGFFDGLWGSDSALRVDFGARSTHVVALAGKAIVQRYYAQAPAHSYFRGCSTGGREAESEAQHYPADFNGIIGGDPAYPARQGGIANNWLVHWLLTPNGDSLFSPVTLSALHAAVLRKCDGIDGVQDGIIAEPRDCHFDVSSIACPNRQPRSDCLTPKQVKAAEELYKGPHDSAGRRLYPGNVPFGSELSWNGNIDFTYVDQYLKYLAFPHNPPTTYNIRNFDFDQDVQKLTALAALYDPVPPDTHPDLRAFHRRGGKLVIYHGGEDYQVSPLTTLDYYAEVTQREGGLTSVQQWFRVFIVPGMYHCRGGNVPDHFDMLTPMLAWVEHGQAPNRIVATQLDESGKTVRTRPLFPYPTVARYSEHGDVNDAANWDPASPRSHHRDDIPWIWDPDTGR